MSQQHRVRCTAVVGVLFSTLFANQAWSQQAPEFSRSLSFLEYLGSMVEEEGELLDPLTVYEDHEFMGDVANVEEDGRTSKLEEVTVENAPADLQVEKP